MRCHYGIEEGADNQGSDYRAGQGVDVREGDQEIMECRVDGLEDTRDHHRKSAVDEGTVVDEIYVVEAEHENGKTFWDRDRHRTKQPQRQSTTSAPQQIQNGR